MANDRNGSPCARWPAANPPTGFERTAVIKDTRSDLRVKQPETEHASAISEQTNGSTYCIAAGSLARPTMKPDTTRH